MASDLVRERMLQVFDMVYTANLLEILILWTEFFTGHLNFTDFIFTYLIIQARGLSMTVSRHVMCPPKCLRAPAATKHWARSAMQRMARPSRKVREN